MKVCVCVCVVLLQHGAEPTIRNTDGRTALDLADASAKAVLTGELDLTGTFAGAHLFVTKFGRGGHGPVSINYYSVVTMNVYQ